MAYQGVHQKRQNSEGRKGERNARPVHRISRYGSEQSVVDCGRKLDTKGLVLGSIWRVGFDADRGESHRRAVIAC